MAQTHQRSLVIDYMVPYDYGKWTSLLFIAVCLQIFIFLKFGEISSRKYFMYVVL